jgi:hypothetical protein
MHGDSNRSVSDFDGLTLVTVKNAKWEKMFVESAGS